MSTQFPAARRTPALVVITGIILASAALLPGCGQGGDAGQTRADAKAAVARPALTVASTARAGELAAEPDGQRQHRRLAGGHHRRRSRRPAPGRGAGQRRRSRQARPGAGDVRDRGVQADLRRPGGGRRGRGDAGRGRANAERAKQLQAQGFLSAQATIQFVTAEQTARARLAAQRAALQAEEVRLAQTRVVAPDDGVISARSATVGVAAGPTRSCSA